MIHLAAIDPQAMMSGAPRSRPQTEEANRAHSQARDARPSDAAAPVARDRSRGAGEAPASANRDTAAHDPKNQDPADQQGFGRALSHALRGQETSPNASGRSLKIVLTPPNGAKTSKLSSNNGTANSPAVVPVPVPSDANALPLYFSVPTMIGEQPTAASKNSSASSAADGSVTGVAGNPESPEKLQLDHPQAFSARIKPVDAPAANGPDPAGEESNAPNPFKPVVEAGSTGTWAAANLVTQAMPAVVAHGPAISAHAPAASVASVSASHAVTETKAVEAPSRPEPLHNITVQLPGARGVEVRLSDQGGEIRVDVRSGDPALTQNLRGNLHELVSGLEHKGFTAQVSHPGEASPGHNADGNASKQQSPDDHGGGSGRHQQDRREAEQSPDQRSPRTRAAWTEALNANSEMPASK